jgi:hypothetical protein
MDPVTAFFVMVTAVANMITKMIEGQPQAVKEKAWERWEASLERWDNIWLRLEKRDKEQK